MSEPNHIDLDAVARARHALHADHPTHRPLAKNHDLVGLHGEKALADFFGGSVDITMRPGGDAGVDLWANFRRRDGTVDRFRIDAKCARKPYNLIVERGKCQAETIYVLARFEDDPPRATLLGWEWGETLLRTKPRDFGYGVLNHHLPAAKLRGLQELLSRMVVS